MIPEEVDSSGRAILVFDGREIVCECGGTYLRTRDGNWTVITPCKKRCKNTRLEDAGGVHMRWPEGTVNVLDEEEA